MRWRLPTLLASIVTSACATAPPLRVEPARAPAAARLATDAPSPATPRDDGPRAAVAWRAVVFSASSVRAAAWTRDAAVAVTSTDVWWLHPDQPERARAVPLAGPLQPGGSAVLAASEASELVAVGLGDGRIDLLRAGERVRTLPAIAAHAELLELEIAPDERTLAVTASVAGKRSTVTPFDLVTNSPGPSRARTACSPQRERSACAAGEACAFEAGGPVCEPERPRGAKDTRADGRYRITHDAMQGFRISDASTYNDVVAWGTRIGATIELVFHDGAIEARDATRSTYDLLYRFGAPAAPRGSAPFPFPPEGPCADQPRRFDVGEVSSVYTVEGVGSIQVVCRCTASGCTRTPLRAGRRSDPIYLPEIIQAMSDDGTMLTSSHDGELFVYTRGSAPARHTLPACPLGGAVFVGSRLFALCFPDRTGPAVVELSPSTLAILAHRPAPSLACPGGGSVLRRLGDDLYFGCLTGEEGFVLPGDWVADATLSERAKLFAWRDAGIVVTREGKVQIAGDEAAAAKAVHCFDGERLLPFAACRDAL